MLSQDGIQDLSLELLKSTLGFTLIMILLWASNVMWALKSTGLLKSEDGTSRPNYVLVQFLTLTLKNTANTKGGWEKEYQLWETRKTSLTIKESSSFTNNLNKKEGSSTSLESSQNMLKYAMELRILCQCRFPHVVSSWNMAGRIPIACKFIWFMINGWLIYSQLSVRTPKLNYRGVFESSTCSFLFYCTL